MMSQSELRNSEQESKNHELISQITTDSFQEWWCEREFARNIRQGKPYFNGPSQIPAPERHSPSRLLSCHRKIYYQLYNAPEETPEPSGIFWFGSKFENNIAVPFLQHLTGSEQYVQNSIWIDFTEEINNNELRFRGETDPVIVNPEGEPQLLTEIKTTTSFTNLDTPKTHHKAQAHAYLKGLSEKFDQQCREAVIIYGKRDDLDFRAFRIRFDPDFWESQVLGWANQNTEYRQINELPPAEPEYQWECEFCSFRKRCGQTEDPHSDVGQMGFLPLTEYPRKHVKDYLQAYPVAKLTPTLAKQYPSLRDKYGVYDWNCKVCGTSYSFGSIEWDGQVSEPPWCPSCRNQRIPAPLTGPSPEDQIQQSGDQGELG